MKAYRYRIYPSKTQEKVLRAHLWISKELWNELLEHAKRHYVRTGKFPSKTHLQTRTKGKGLHSQVAQAVAHRLHRALKRIWQMRSLGNKSGFPRFKNFDRMKSLYYPQTGFKLDKKLKVMPFGEINIRKHREVEGKIKALTLKCQSSCKWFAIFTVETEKIKPPLNCGKQIGIDLGLKAFATLSDRTKIQNPRFYHEKEKLLARFQQRLSRRQKGGHNRNKLKVKIATLHERIANLRNDFLHKQSRILVKKYSFIAMEELNVQEMTERRLGKQINDASWSRFASFICYKAESAGCRVVFVDPRGTTKTCSKCGLQQEMPLKMREFACNACGLLLDRDLNAANNILARATAGMAGSNAWGDGEVSPPRNQETLREI